MELEQRVKALEYEVKILKNEIQRVLLDIHEQVLVHYYPSLRQDDGTPPEGVAMEIESIRSKQSFAEPEPTLVIKKVSLDEVRAAHTEPPPSPQPAPVAPLAGPGAYQTTMVKMSDWASKAAAKIGGDRTAELVRIYASRAFLPAETTAILLRLASLDKSPEPGSVAVSELVAILLQLDEMIGRPVDIEEVLSVIEEAHFG